MTTKMFGSLLPAAIACAALLAAGVGRAEDYPARPIKLIIPFAAGATNDIVGRLVAGGLSRRLGQPVVVENKTGSGGTIGTAAAAKAPADGYTLLLGNRATMVTAPLLFRDLPYVPQRDFDEVIIVADSPSVLVVNPSLPVRSLNELVAYAKAHPGQLNFASPGTGTSMHLMAELLKLNNGIEMTHVAYRGGAPAALDLLAGRVQLMFDNPTSVLPHIKSGALRALAVTSTRRMALLPDVPTVAEAGSPGLTNSSWFSIAVPKGVPTPIVARLQREIGATLKEDEVKQRLADVGTDPGGAAGVEAERIIVEDAARWTDVVKKSGVRVQ